MLGKARAVRQSRRLEMPIRIGSNVASINAGRHLDRNQQDFAKRIERLSSGLRINRGADDAAGLSVSEGMRAELKGCLLYTSPSPRD